MSVRRRRKADDDAHRPRRIGLRPCDTRDGRERGSARCQMQKLPAGKFHGVLLCCQGWRDAQHLGRRCSRASAKDSRAAHTADNAISDDHHINSVYGCRHAVERSHRTPDEAARPPCPDGRRAGRQHGEGGALLNTSQPAISKSIAELEHALGVRLLDRNRQGVEPTEYGRALLDGGVAVFDDLRQAVKNIEFLADPTAGEVRIGCNPLLAASFVSAVVDRLSRRYPRIVFHLVTGRCRDAAPRTERA